MQNSTAPRQIQGSSPTTGRTDTVIYCKSIGSVWNFTFEILNKASCYRYCAVNPFQTNGKHERLVISLIGASCKGIDVLKPGWYRMMCEDTVWKEIHNCYYANNILCRGTRPSQVFNIIYKAACIQCGPLIWSTDMKHAQFIAHLYMVILH